MYVIWNYDCCVGDEVKTITDFKQLYDTSISVISQVQFEFIVDYTHNNNILNMGKHSYKGEHKS